MRRISWCGDCEKWIRILFFYSLIFSFSTHLLFAKTLFLNSLWVGGGAYSNVSLNNPAGFCIDPETQNIYIADTGNNRIVIFSASGESIGVLPTSIPLSEPFDIVFGPDGCMYVSQMNRSLITVFNKKGVYIWCIPKGYMNDEIRPGRMSFDGKGRLFFADRLHGQIGIIDEKGKLIKRFGNTGDGGLLTGILVGEDARVYTSWGQGKAIRIFDQEGEIISMFGEHIPLESGFSFPTSLAMDKRGRLWIVDAFRKYIKVFTPEGSCLFQSGVKNQASNGFIFPVDIAFGQEEKLYILEKGEGLLRVLLQGPE